MPASLTEKLELQAARVKYVKTRHSYVIEKPLVLPRRATIASAAPSAASSRAIAWPMPWLAPPTSATRPFSDRSTGQLRVAR